MPVLKRKTFISPCYKKVIEKLCSVFFDVNSYTKATKALVYYCLYITYQWKRLFPSAKFQLSSVIFLASWSEFYAGRLYSFAFLLLKNGKIRRLRTWNVNCNGLQYTSVSWKLRLPWTVTNALLLNETKTWTTSLTIAWTLFEIWFWNNLLGEQSQHIAPASSTNKYVFFTIWLNDAKLMWERFRKVWF